MIFFCIFSEHALWEFVFPSHDGIGVEREEHGVSACLIRLGV